MEEENVEAVTPLHAAPFWWWGAAWRGVGHVSPLLGAGSLVEKLALLSLMGGDAPRGLGVTPRR